MNTRLQHLSTRIVNRSSKRRNGIMSRASLIVAAAMCAAMPSALSAQGNVSMLGFGYPVGGLSTRASGTTGAFAEFDALSPFNPAALYGIQRSVLTLQAEPEFRTLSFNGANERSRTQRTPLIMLGMRVTPRAVVGLSAASFLDRSYATTSTGSAVIEGQTVPTTDRIVSTGSISDMRLGVGYVVNKRLRVGVGGHLFTGANTVALSRKFADTITFGAVLDSSTVAYFGTGLSVGGEYQVVKGLTASGSFRLGGRLDATRKNNVTHKDSLLSRANVPDRLGLGVRYEGIPGSVFAINVEQVNWSAMRGLGTSAVTVQDATNWSIGGETAGPKFLSNATLLRAGFAHNALPFGLGSNFTKENRFGVGIGIPLRVYAAFDFSLQRASRTLSGSGAKEGAWLFGAGMQVRP